MNNMLACNSCGSNQIESTVQFGSYVLRCAACGEDIVATSFLAIGDIDREFSAYVDPGHGKQPTAETLIAHGPLRQISAAIRAVAGTGTSVLLVPTT
ncbi:MAG: hypothetical protein M9924_21240 [Rhizobiaceae bacterium]|nr:hypothetical protein [Rhizobiaceae bacterium]